MAVPTIEELLALPWQTRLEIWEALRASLHKPKAEKPPLTNALPTKPTK